MRHFAVGEDIGRNGQVGEEVQLLKDDADALLPGLSWIANDHRLSTQHKRPAVRLIDAGQHLHDGRLAGAVLSNDSMNLGRSDTERHVVNGGDAAETLGHMVEPDDLISHGRCSNGDARRWRSPVRTCVRTGLVTKGYGAGVARGMPGVRRSSYGRAASSKSAKFSSMYAW